MRPWFGAHPLAGGETLFQLWAPQARLVELMLEHSAVAMLRSEDGIWRVSTQAAPGSVYHYRIDGDMQVPDPASRAQAQDVHGPSVVVDLAFDWQTSDWRGRPWNEAVIYELHPGLAGGFRGIQAQLPRLQALGITALQLMPIASFPGTRNWGYDGVLPYAPANAYGTPAELQAMIDAAHGIGLQVFLDVVYNHFGPDGNYLGVYAQDFFRADKHTPWGNAIDFHRPQVRKFFIGNALHWLLNYRFDGLRFDAVHSIGDSEFLHEMAAEIRNATKARHVHLILENEENDASLIGGGAHNYDAQWADDFHHCVHVLLTGEQDAYYEDFNTPAAQLCRCLAEGFAYQGEPSVHAGGAPRGTRSGHLPPTAFVACLQNHDQIGNRAFGERLTTLANPEALRAAIALLLLTPQIPMIFFGEEWGETRPFLYFTAHNAELGALVTQGRRKEFSKFPAFADAKIRETIPDPNAPATYEASRPVEVRNEWTSLYREALALRARVIARRIPGTVSLGARPLGTHALHAGWRLGDGAALWLAVNLGAGPVAFEPPPGKQLFGPALQGALPGYTFCLWVDE